MLCVAVTKLGVGYKDYLMNVKAMGICFFGWEMIILRSWRRGRKGDGWVWC